VRPLDLKYARIAALVPLLLDLVEDYPGFEERRIPDEGLELAALSGHVDSVLLVELHQLP